MNKIEHHHCQYLTINSSSIQSKTDHGDIYVKLKALDLIFFAAPCAKGYQIGIRASFGLLVPKIDNHNSTCGGFQNQRVTLVKVMVSLKKMMNGCCCGQFVFTLMYYMLVNLFYFLYMNE